MSDTKKIVQNTFRIPRYESQTVEFKSAWTKEPIIKTLVAFANTAGGDLYIGAYGIVNRVAFLFVMVVMGLNQGMQPIVGYNYGAEKYDRVIKVLGMTIGWAMAITTVGFIVSEVFPYAVVHLFVSEDGSGEATALIDAAAHGLKIIMMLTMDLLIIQKTILQ